MAMSEVATTKGTILNSLLKFIKADLTPEQYEAAIAQLPPDDRAMLATRVLPSSHVPETLLNHLTDVAAKAKNEPLETFGRRAGMAEVADAVGLYRFLVVVLTPNALLSKASNAWSSVHNTGKMLVEDQTANSARIRLRDFASEPAHCARLTGWFVRLSEMTGAKNVRITHDECLTRGARDCSWDLSWGHI
jgi:uncharacterized protein (TIGR02265 family)